LYLAQNHEVSNPKTSNSPHTKVPDTAKHDIPVVFDDTKLQETASQDTEYQGSGSRNSDELVENTVSPTPAGGNCYLLCTVSFTSKLLHR